MSIINGQVGYGEVVPAPGFRKKAFQDRMMRIVPWQV